MRKIVFLLVFSFAVIGVFANNRSEDSVIGEFEIESFNINNQEDPETDCRNQTETVIWFLYHNSDMSMQELSDLETELLINCFEANI